METRFRGANKTQKETKIELATVNKNRERDIAGGGNTVEDFFFLREEKLENG